MAEITLGDLLAWEPRLRAASGFGHPGESGRGGDRGGGYGSDRELTWAVAARATAPMLPPMRGGELVLLPHRVLAESGISIGPLLRELATHAAAGVLLEAEAVPPGLRAIGAPLPIVVLPVGPMTPDLESDLNRLLTQRRGELYRAGSDLGRLLAGLTSVGADVGQVLAATADALGIATVVLDANGHQLAAVGTDGGGQGGAVAEPRPSRGAAPHEVSLRGGRTLLLGPVTPESRALARLAGERVAVAVEAALARSAETRPRGPARAAALAAFLTPDDAAVVDFGVRAVALGLASDATFRVALASAAVGPSGLQRLLAPSGTVHDATALDGWSAAIVDVRDENAAVVRDAETSGLSASARPDGAAAVGTDAATVWIAVSAPVVGPRPLPGAARQARYLAALLARGMLRGPVARFDHLREVGAYRLLYDAWGSADLAAFAADALGELPLHDRRGTLRQTLLAYLETGGSHVETASRLRIHRNTLAYRLRQISALTGYDPTDPRTRMLLHLALLAAALPPVPPA